MRLAYDAEWEVVKRAWPPIGFPHLENIHNQARAQHKEHVEREAASEQTRKRKRTAEDDKKGARAGAYRKKAGETQN